MRTFDQLLSRGYGYVIVAKVQGIPDLFAETMPLRVDAEEPPGLPAGYRSASAALFFGESSTISQEIDRETGFARGDALGFTLTWSALEEDDLLVTLFRRSSKRVRLSADLAHDAVSADVTSTTGWVASEDAYLGREYVPIEAVADGDTLKLTRGRATPVTYDYRANSPTAYSWLSDRPELWRGRFVTFYRHLLTPEGRILDSAWTTGAYCEELWQGYLDGHPVPDELGMTFRAMPLYRIVGEDLGYEATAKGIAPNPEDLLSFAAIPIVMGPDSYIRIEGEYSGPGSGTLDLTIRPAVSVPTVTTIGGWCRAIQTALDNALTSYAWYTITSAQVGVQGAVSWETTRAVIPGAISLQIPYDSAYTVTLSLAILDTPDLYWVTPGQRQFAPGLMNRTIANFVGDWPAVRMSYQVGSWLPVVQTEGEGYLDLTLPTEGVGLAEVDDAKELVRWDAKESVPSAWSGGGTLLRIAERGVAGSSLVDLTGAELKVVTGADGTPASCLLQLLESSGTGSFGASDTLGVGQGYGVPEDLIDVASFAVADLVENEIPAYSDGRSSLEDLMGGWLALTGRCLVLRRSTDGRLRLALVPVEPVALAGRSAEVSITAADVELTGIGVPELYDAPGEVSVARSGVALDVPDVIVQDVAALQQSLSRRVDYSAPGISERVAIDLATLRLALGRGQSLVTLPVAPWLSVDVGTVVADELGHGASYDWSTGTRRPARLAGVVVGTTLSVWSGRRTVTILRAGYAPEGLYLCPTAGVLSATSDTLTVDQDLTELWGPLAGEVTVTVYTPGKEATERVEVLCEIVTATTLTRVSGTWPGWVGAGSLVTFSPLGGNHPSVEAAYLFQTSTRNWSA